MPWVLFVWARRTLYGARFLGAVADFLRGRIRPGRSSMAFAADPRSPMSRQKNRRDSPPSARTPLRFRDRVLALFRSPQNLAYLRDLFTGRVPAGPLRNFARETLDDALFEYASGDGRALEVLASDPFAQRGALRPAVGLWDEVRRLNRAFYEDRLALLQEQASIIERRDCADDEPYHMRMFVSDSLRPPGLEHLNSAGPLYALREDQAGRSREQFARSREQFADDDIFIYGEDDAPWSRGDPNRSSEQALAEYWGDGQVATNLATESRKDPHAYGDAYAWGNTWRENGGTRFMRRETIPFWQQGGREGYDRDIEDTLGTAGRELDGHVRRWDMDRVRKPRGQEYRRFGPRSGHIV